MARKVFNPEPQAVIEALEDNNGHVSTAARSLCVSYSTLNTWLKKHPEVLEIKNELSDVYRNVMLDKAESVVEQAMDMADEDIKAALKAAFFVLMQRGDDRGYCHVKDSNNDGAVNTQFTAWLGAMRTLKSETVVAP